LVPESVPGVSLTSAGLCNLCRAADPSAGEASDEAARCPYEEDLERTVADARGRGAYDCVVALSGGKDGLYLLSVVSQRSHPSRWQVDDLS
jgi:hypothetical protein